MAEDDLFAQVLDQANRADPYPLYEEIRRKPVSRQHDGAYVVSSHAAIRSLVFDPRISSEDLPPSRRPNTGNPINDWIVNRIKDRITNTHRPLIFRDPPDHDMLRGFVMQEFTTERVWGLHDRVKQLVDDLIDKVRDRREVCLVEDLSYPLPVAVICDMLGVPEEDEPKFQKWASKLATALEPDAREDDDNKDTIAENFDAISAHMRALIKERRKNPTDDMLSGLIKRSDNDRKGMDQFDLIATSVLLLIAGHETTVNLITNGMLTLLRHPDELEKLRADPGRAPRVIEELLRYEPPVHFRTRKALADIEVAGVTIPKDAAVILLFAAGNRDPARFENPDRFDPDRKEIQHFGFGGGLHFCAGAPLARMETEVALVELCQRLLSPRLSVDPPPYRKGASLRGPKNLGVMIDGIG